MGLVTEAIKRMFSRNTTNAASQSGARVPIVNVNGDPIGNDSLANFSSVLGVVFKYSGHFITSEYLPNGKLEDMRGNTTMRGLWGVSTTNLLPSDFPTGWKDGAVVNIDFYSEVSLQIAFNRQGGVQARFYWYGSWKDWG